MLNIVADGDSLELAYQISCQLLTHDLISIQLCVLLGPRSELFHCLSSFHFEITVEAHQEFLQVLLLAQVTRRSLLTILSHLSSSRFSLGFHFFVSLVTQLLQVERLRAEDLSVELTRLVHFGQAFYHALHERSLLDVAQSELRTGLVGGCLQALKHVKAGSHVSFEGL